MVIKREKWKNRYVYVSREKGKIISWKNVKGSKLNLSSAKAIFNSKGSFNPKISIRRSKLKNFTEVSKLTETKVIDGKIVRSKEKIRISKDQSQVLQYVVEAKINGITVASRSRRIGARPSIATKEQARSEAWSKFLRAVAQTKGFGSDEEEGLRLIKQGKIKIKEGFIYYQK